MNHEISVTVIVLTYNRPHLVNNRLKELAKIRYQPFEVIIVDNHSDQPLDKIVKKYPFAKLLRMNENLGVGARNYGIQAASGNILITLDDDVSGITDSDIHRLINIFCTPSTGAACFKILDDITGDIVNWCHHRRQESFIDREFITEEISEGAVAFRRSALTQSGLYPQEFFISHEGADLALRLMNCGYNVIYTPEITVVHCHAQSGRPGWRRYYYDTRNLVWLVLRNYPLIRGAKLLTVGLGSMMVYALRDGFFKYWATGLADGLAGSRKALSNRIPINDRTRSILRDIDQYRPGIWYMIKKRLFSQKVRI